MIDKQPEPLIKPRGLKRCFIEKQLPLAANTRRRRRAFLKTKIYNISLLYTYCNYDSSQPQLIETVTEYTIKEL